MLRLRTLFGIIGALLLTGRELAGQGTGGVPRDRYLPLLVYDSLADRFLLFGGSFGPRDSRTYAYRNGAWSVLADSGPTSRDDMAFGMMGSVPVFFGGRATENTPTGPRFVAYRETWRLEGANWVKVDSLGPESRSHPMGAYDPIRRRLVLFGGRSGVAQRGEPNRPFASGTWEWDGARWHQFTGDEPPGRAGHVIAWDAKARMVVIHGGVRDNIPLTDTWGWNGERWRKLADNGPRTLFGAAATWPAGGIVLFGGHRMEEASSAETFHWDGTSWRVVAASGPAATTFNVLATDTRRQRVYMIGGESNDFWYLDSEFRWVKVY